MAENDSKKIVGGLFWAFGERISSQFVSTLVTIVLARLLDPENYGMISIVMVFISFLDVFVTGSFSSALVQKKSADNLDFNTCFFLSFGLAWVLYAALFAFSPTLAHFYNMNELSAVIRVMGLRLPIAAINSIQQAYIQRAMEFRRFFWATLAGTLISGIIGISMAYVGCGIWSLVAQYLTNAVINTVILFFIGGWKLKFQFSIQRLKKIWSFGGKVLATQLLFTFEGNIRSLIVGKVFGPADLAYFDQGKKYPNLLVSNINTSINKVMLPAFSERQDDHERLVSALSRSIRIGIYVLTPVLLGFAMVSEDFVHVILTDKWLPCVPFIQIFCLSYLTRPLESSCQQALLAVGKSGTVLICIMAINGASILLTLISVFILRSVLAIALFTLLITLISIAVFMRFTHKHLGYSHKQQLFDLLPSLAIGIIMSAIVYLVALININPIVSLFLQILVGLATYISMSVLFKIEPFYFLLSFFKNMSSIKKH